jgi:aryl-alcohol dehydrogenase-like predicted oxidoreductase
MERLIKEGKVRFAGVSNFTVALLERCEAIRHVDSLQCPLSLIRPQAAKEEIPWCLAHGVGVLGYSPMQSGLLTDAFGRERLAALSPSDWRRTMREFQEPHLSANLDLRDALRSAAERHDTTVAAVAVAWAISQPGLTAVIAGARSAEQVDGWVKAANIRLSQTDCEEIADAANAAAARKRIATLRFDVYVPVASGGGSVAATRGTRAVTAPEPKASQDKERSGRSVAHSGAVTV